MWVFPHNTNQQEPTPPPTNKQTKIIIDLKTFINIFSKDKQTTSQVGYICIYVFELFEMKTKQG